MSELLFAKSVWVASFALPLVAVFAACASFRARGVVRLAALLCLAVALAANYARFIEPRILRTPEHDIALKSCFAEAGAVRLAVFSDAHLGLFPNSTPMARVVHALETVRPDATLFAGDWVYHLEPSRFDAALAPLKGLSAPLYSVFGNHDVGLAEPDIHAPFSAALKRTGARPIDKESVALSTPRGVVEIAGFTDFRDGVFRVEGLRTPTERPRILLSHYPDWADDMRGVDVDLFLAGHTHGGQIYLPGLTCRLYRRACRVARYGLVERNGALLFVTSGTGMVGLPMRFLAPPRIDVLNVSWRACADPQAE